MMEEDLSGRREEEQRELIGGNTPNSSSSPPPPFLFPSFCSGEEGDEDEEARVTVVTEEANSCSSEAFSTAHLERSANQCTQREDGGDRQEVMSPLSPLLSQVRSIDEGLVVWKR